MSLRAARPGSSRSIVAVLAAGVSLAGAGCPSTTPPTVDVPALPGTAAPAAPAPVRPAGPIVLFSVQDGLLAPVVCHDGKEALPSDSPECLDLAPEGSAIALAGGGKATLGPQAEVPCRRSELNTFLGRKATSGALTEPGWAVWPESAAGAVVRMKEAIQPAGAEIAAMAAMLREQAEDRIEEKPKLEITGGLAADIDGDGAADRIFGAHNALGMYGVVAAFRSSAPGVAVNVSVLAHDRPRLLGVTELDGKPGYEVWIGGEFVEGIEDSVVTSAVYERVIAVRNGEAKELGSWGCRMF